MGTCDLRRLAFIFEPESWLGESGGCCSAPNISPEPSGVSVNPETWPETVRGGLPGPWAMGLPSPGWLLYSSHCLSQRLSVGSNTWNQASALENVPALPSWITVWMLQGLVYSFSDPSVMTYLWRSYQALTRCKVPCRVPRVKRISVYFNRSIVRVCDGPDISEAIFSTPGLGTCFLHFSLSTLSPAASTSAHVLQLLRKYFFAEGSEDQLEDDEFQEDGMLVMSDAARTLMRWEPN